MSKFCASCGVALGEGAKFCTGCGAAVYSVPAEAEAALDDISPQKDAIASKASEKIKEKAKKEAKAYIEKPFADVTPTYVAAGEIALPMEFTLFPAAADGEGLFAVLKSGWKGLMGGFKLTLGDKKRLVVVIALSIVWLLVNVLAALDIFPLPIRLISWLTAAQGSLIGGTVGKGLVAALLSQIITDKGMFSTLKSGFGQLGGIVKSGKRKFVPLLLGVGVALIVCNMMVHSNLQNTMVPIAGFVLSVKALTQNGFLCRIVTALIPETKGASLVVPVMGGWTLGFALFATTSLLPGRWNGFLLGILLLIVGGILAVMNKSKKEVAL